MATAAARCAARCCAVRCVAVGQTHARETHAPPLPLPHTQSGEDMVIVPKALMISPPTAYADPDIGHVFSEHPKTFRGQDDK